MNFGVVIYKGVQPMDVIGPWEVWATWGSLLKAPIHLYLVAETDQPVACASQISLKPHVDFVNCPQLDYLVLPGGQGRIEEVHNEKTISFIQAQAVHCKKVLSVCTGMFLLAKAGLLKGKAATTYWRALPELKELGIQVVEERLVKSGKIWTSGGISSGIDLALALIEEIGGKEVAGQVQLLFEYFPRNTMYCSANSFRSLPAYQGAKGPVLPHLPKYMREELE